MDEPTLLDMTLLWSAIEIAGDEDADFDEAEAMAAHSRVLSHLRNTGVVEIGGG